MPHLPGFIFAILQECQKQSEVQRMMKSTVCSYEFFFVLHPAKSLFSCFAFSYCSPGISGFISPYSSVDVFKRVRHSIKRFLFPSTWSSSHSSSCLLIFCFMLMIYIPRTRTRSAIKNDLFFQ